LDSAGNRLATNTELRYYPYGVARYIAGTTPTSFNFTGQRKDAGSGLLFYNARWYDPVVGRFLQADTIVPSPGDPQSLNRYSYTLNNPLRYVDPSGHDPLDQAWHDEFEQVHHRAPTAEDIQIRLFSIAFPNEWNWSAFYNSDGSYIQGSLENVFRDQRPANWSWQDMPGALECLAGWYKTGEEEFYTRDIGSLFAGLIDRMEAPAARHAIYNGGRGSAHVWVYLDRNGLSSSLTGTADDDANVHHWAWALTMGAEYGPGGSLINTVREAQQFNGDWRNSWSDLSIGNRGAALGAHFRVLGLTDITRAWNFYMVNR
jgi:RHS repeat-associated protein